MAELRFLSKIEQVAAHLRAELSGGRWVGTMPGRVELAAELRLNERTVEEALRQLEKEGVLLGQGAGKRRLIALPRDLTAPAMRVKILSYEESDRQQHFMVDVLHRLLNMGHSASYASKNLKDLGMDLSRVRRFIQKEEADAWMIMAGSREILKWFAQQATPSFAIAGRRRGIPIAGIGPDRTPARRAAVSRLVALGHRRISLIVREERRKPTPGIPERAFLEDLETHGIKTGAYNLPDWKDDVHDFHRCLDSLFQHTPPTALLVDEIPLFVATQQHLAQHGILAPRDVSLICLDPHPVFAWSQPSVAHINWEIAPVIRRMVNWADNVARGKDDRRQSSTLAKFVEGGTIGPAKLPKNHIKNRDR
jgi:DNA-binding LacI/PurR family transcriptional regulator/DNA-binding transcriptional regulator YhcF (GntR family)